MPPVAPSIFSAALDVLWLRAPWRNDSDSAALPIHWTLNPGGGNCRSLPLLKAKNDAEDERQDEKNANDHGIMA